MNNLWGDVLSGSIAGVVGGVVVAVLLGAATYMRKPKAELRYISKDKALLIHRGLRAGVIGGSFVIGDGTVLWTPDNRAGHSGILVPARSETILRTSEYLHIGTVVSLSWKAAPLFHSLIIKQGTKVYRMEREAIQPDGDGWKTLHLTYRP